MGSVCLLDPRTIHVLHVDLTTIDLSLIETRKGCFVFIFMVIAVNTMTRESVILTPYQSVILTPYLIVVKTFVSEPYFALIICGHYVRLVGPTGQSDDQSGCSVGGTCCLRHSYIAAAVIYTSGG